MLQRESPDDFVIATGESYPLSRFVELAFTAVGLDWRDHVQADPALLRPTDIRTGRADPSKASRELGWRATYKMPDVVRLMIGAEQSGDALPQEDDAAAPTRRREGPLARPTVP
jgi:GDPmannose 4,6-dehydratase